MERNAQLKPCTRSIIFVCFNVVFGFAVVAKTQELYHLGYDSLIKLKCRLAIVYVTLQFIIQLYNG